MIQTHLNSQPPKRELFPTYQSYFREFCKRTGIHGFQYFGESGRSRFERYWWIIVLLISFAGCSYSVYHTYKKWERSPIVVNFASKGTPIYTIPFPAVTICPEVKTAREKFNYTEVMHKREDGIPLTTEENSYFEYMSLICDHNSHLNYSGNDTFSDDLFEVVDYLKPDFDIRNCSFFPATSVDCKALFTPIFTEDGICYSFNILDRSEIFKDAVLQYKDFHIVSQNVTTEWTIQGGYRDKENFSVYPHRAFLPGVSSGLSLNIFTAHKDLDYICKTPLQGYRILVYTPMTIPRPRLKYFRLPLDQSVVAAVDPFRIKTSYLIKKYSAEKRGCYFQHERFLKYFKAYTANHCSLECVTNYTLYFCKCVRFFMPRHNGTPICGTGKFNCLEYAEGLMQYATLQHQLKQGHLLKLPDDFPNSNCNCLPLCTDLTYQVETSQTSVDLYSWMKALRQVNGHNNISVSALTVYFTRDMFITSQRNELYGPLDFLANFGGLIGLFTGLSVISIAEIIYFLTLRCFCNRRRHQRRSPQV